MWWVRYISALLLKATMRIICVPSNFSISRDSVPDHLSSIYSLLLVTILQGNGEMLYRMESYTLIFSGGFSSSCAFTGIGTDPLDTAIKTWPKCTNFSPRSVPLLCISNSTTLHPVAQTRHAVVPNHSPSPNSELAWNCLLPSTLMVFAFLEL